MAFVEMCWVTQRLCHGSAGAELADSFCSSVNSDRTPTNCAVFSTVDTFGCPGLGLCASVTKGMARRPERSKPLAELISIMMAHDPPWENGERRFNLLLRWTIETQPGRGVMKGTRTK